MKISLYLRYISLLIFDITEEWFVVRESKSADGRFRTYDSPICFGVGVFVNPAWPAQVVLGQPLAKSLHVVQNLVVHKPTGQQTVAEGWACTPSLSYIGPSSVWEWRVRSVLPQFPHWRSKGPTLQKGQLLLKGLPVSSFILLLHILIVQSQQMAFSGSSPQDLWLWLGPMSGLPIALPSSENLPEAGKALVQMQHSIGVAVGGLGLISFPFSVSISFPGSVCGG